MDDPYNGRLIQKQFLACHGIMLDAARAEGLAEILAKIDRATAAARETLGPDDSMGDRDQIVAAYRATNR